MATKDLLTEELAERWLNEYRWAVQRADIPTFGVPAITVVRRALDSEAVVDPGDGENEPPLTLHELAIHTLLGMSAAR